MRPAPRALPSAGLASLLPVLAFAGLVALGGRVEIPFVPVPFTLQTLAAMGAGLALGPKRGAAAVGAVLLAGGLGAPVFSGGDAGAAHLVGPTAAYLWALPLLAAGYGFARGRVLASLGVSLAHLLVGAAWLALFVGPAKALAAGVAPFLLAEGVKAAAALGTLGAARGLRR